jgi:hypothetical protein
MPRPWASAQERARKPFIDGNSIGSIAPTDIDLIVSELNHRTNRGRATLT